MSSEKIIDALGCIDDEMIEEVEKLQKAKKGNSRKWVRWGALVAGLALIIATSWPALKDIMLAYPNNTEPSIEPGATQGCDYVNLDTEQMIYVNCRLYAPAPELSQIVTQRNAGDFFGYVSLNGKNETAIPAYVLEGTLRNGNSIVIDYNGAYYAYTFYAFVPDGSKEWPVNLLTNAAHIEVRDPNYGIDNQTVYLILSAQQDITNMLDFLSALGEKHDQMELNKRCYERFKPYFTDEDLWLDREGNIGTSSIEIGAAFRELVCGMDRRLVVVMEDGAELTYSYLPGAGVMLCDDFAYFLSDEQVSQINPMIGLQS